MPRLGANVILKSWKFWTITLLVVAVLLLISHGVNMDKVHAYAERLNPVVVFLLVTLLPLVGFPVNVLHFAAGVRFGVGWGLVVVAASIFIQLLATYGLVHWKEAFFKRKFRKLRERIPPGAHRAVTVFTLLLPGAPFFAQNYTLAIVGVPLRTMLCWALPLHVFRASISVMVGDQSDHLTAGRVALMAAYLTAMLLVSWWAYRRVKAQLKDPPPKGNGRKSRASGRSSARGNPSR